MRTELLQYLEGEEITLWTQYLDYERRGQRKRALVILDEFIARLLSAPLERREMFTGQLCTLVVDEGIEMPIRHSLGVNLLYPFLRRGYDQGSALAPWWIARLYRRLNRSREWREWFDANNLTRRTLLAQALRRDPLNDHARHEFIAVLAEGLDFTIHEVPSGVLYGMDGASVEECQDLLEVVDRFRELTRASGAFELYDNRIREWEFHFRGYADYLSKPDHYTSYVDYLQKHRTAWEAIPRGGQGHPES